MIEQNLVGYLLDVLDANERQQVEILLATDPEARQRLELLRQALSPLDADRDGFSPPPGLRYRTVAKVAELRCQRDSRVRKAPPIRSAVVSRSWWRRADVLVAASLLMIVLPLVAYSLSYVQFRKNILYCQNNLRGFHAALMAYSDMHEGQLPKVEEAPPRNVAGIFVPVLHQDRLIQNVSIHCPSTGMERFRPMTLQEFEEIWSQRTEDSARVVGRLAGCYAYPLGYRDERTGRLAGLRVDRNRAELDRLPLMADRPPFQQNGMVLATSNSKNHGGKGQNVLYMGGHVEFFTHPWVGVDRDHIFVNQQGQAAAGVHLFDSVLGGSEFRPYLGGRFDD